MFDGTIASNIAFGEPTPKGRPWPGATKPESFERHVLDLARAFSSRPVYWPYRRNPPLA